MMKFPSKKRIQDSNRTHWFGLAIIMGCSTYYFYQFGVIPVIILLVVQLVVGIHSYSLGQNSLLEALSKKLSKHLDKISKNNQIDTKDPRIEV